MIVHLLIDEKFTDSFVNFVNSNFNDKEHKFLVFCHKSIKYISCQNNGDNVFIIRKNFLGLTKVIRTLKRADKIILHGLFSGVVIKLFSLFKNFAKKSYWYIWGGDLYSYTYENSKLKNKKIKIISNLKGIISPFEMDYATACKEYSAKCNWYEAILPNCITERINIDFKSKKDGRINILAGNSADSENCHLEIIEVLKNFSQADIKVYVPLSYGDRVYANDISEKFKKTLGEKAVPILEFMPFEEYKKLLSSVDVVLFAHKRQQAFGNFILLLMYGAKIYMKSDTSIWKWAEKNNISIYDFKQAHLSMLETLNEDEKKNNYEKVLSLTNKSAVISQWKLIFDI